MLKVEIIEKKFDTILFEDVKIDFERFGLVVISGPSGCGKSTLLNMITHLDDDYKGTITIDGKKVDEKVASSYIAYGHSVQYLLNDLSVEDYYQLYSIHYDYDLIDFDLKLKVGLLSRGQKQRLLLLVTLLQNKPIVVLDEITSGLDEARKKQVLEIIKAYSKNHLVIMVDHDIELLEKYATVIYPLTSHLHIENHHNSIYSKPKHDLTKLKRVVMRYKKGQIYLAGICLFMILISMNLFYFSSNSFSNAMIEAVSSYFPNDSYSFYYEYFNEDTLDCFEKDQYVYLCLDDVELLGIKTPDKIYSIDDYSKSIRKLNEGNYPNADDEIVVGNKIMENLQLKIGDLIELQYVIDNTIETVPFKIVGISNGNEIYFKEYGEFRYLNTFKTMKSSLAIVVISDFDAFEKELKTCSIPNMKIGEGFMKKVEKMVDTIQTILLIVNSIGGFISIFVLIDLLILSVKKRERIMGLMCLNGCSKKEIFKCLFYPYQKMILFTFYLVNLIAYLVISIINELLKNNLHFSLNLSYILLNCIAFILIEGILLVLLMKSMKKKPIHIIQNIR